jgi:hypothetical protein
MKKILLSCFLTLSLIFQLFAQDEPAPVNVEILKKNGEKLRGKIIQIRRDTADFQDNSDGGIYRIPMGDIRNIDYVDQKKSLGSSWFRNPNTLRYFFTSSAFPLEKKSVQLGSTYGFITTVHYGLTDRVSIGGGGDLFGGSVTLLNAKVNVINGAHHKFSAGLHYYRMPKDFIETISGEDVRDLALVTAASTWGNENNHFTLGAGYMYITGGFIPPIVTVGGSVRLIQRLALVTENWFFFVGERTGIPVVLSFGGRYLSRRHTIDFGLFSDHESQFGSVVPYIAYSVKLGRISD